MALPAELYYFGYGSLVNCATRPADECPVPAHLPGWQRQWAHRSSARHGGRGSCSLTVEPLPETPRPEVADASASCDRTGIDGVLVPVNHRALPELDRRESGYDRVEIDLHRFSTKGAMLPQTGSSRVIMYVSKPVRTHHACDRHPILQSYVDCVLAGFLQRFGARGIERFLASTGGWHGVMENDRARPRYPRAQALVPSLIERIDEWVAQARSQT